MLNFKKTVKDIKWRISDRPNQSWFISMLEVLTNMKNRITTLGHIVMILSGTRDTKYQKYGQIKKFIFYKLKTSVKYSNKFTYLMGYKKGEA